MKLNSRLSPDEALREVRRIGHATCQNALSYRWKVNDDRCVPAQSICWLFCWANNGMGSINAAQQAKRAFDKIFDRDYNWLAARLSLDDAHRWRYSLEDIEDEFYARVGPL